MRKPCLEQEKEENINNLVVLKFSSYVSRQPLIHVMPKSNAKKTAVKNNCTVCEFVNACNIIGDYPTTAF